MARKVNRRPLRMPERLLPFQLDGARFLAGRRFAVLGDDMGLGKSAQTIRAADMLNERTVTVIAPAAVVPGWEAEFWRWQDYPRNVHAITSAKHRIPAQGAVALSYERACQPQVSAMLKERTSGHTLVIDEAHYCKDTKAKRTKILLGRDGLASAAARTYCLSGTIMPNNASELYPVMAASGLFRGKFDQFVSRFCATTDFRIGHRWHTKIVGNKNPDQLQALLVRLMLRREESVLSDQLPPVRYSVVNIQPSEIDPGAPVLDELRAIEPDAANLITHAIERQDFRTLATPHIATLRRLIGLAKCGGVAEQAKQFLANNPGEKLVLFGIHRRGLEYLYRELQPFGAVALWGGIPENKRTRNIQAFQENSGARVAVCQIKAAGTGLTLTAARHLWLFESSWVPAENLQAVKRIRRISQTRDQFIKTMTLQHSIDVHVNRVLTKKMADIAEIVQ